MLMYGHKDEDSSAMENVDVERVSHHQPEHHPHAALLEVRERVGGWWDMKQDLNVSGRV